MIRPVFALTLTLTCFTDARAQTGIQAPEVSEYSLDEIIVTGRRRSPPSEMDAIGYFRRYCYEPNRLTGFSATPTDDAGWTPLQARTRAQFGISDPATPAYGLLDIARKSTLLIKIERLPRPGKLIESRCTLAVIGGTEHGRLPGQMSSLFNGAGTQRHVGEVDGTEKVKGWRQWLWSGMPARGSKSWRTVNADRRGTPGGTWLVVSDLSFYNNYDYVLGDLKIREQGDRPVSMVSLAYITRESTKRK